MLMNDKVTAVSMLVPSIQLLEILHRHARLPRYRRSSHTAEVLGEVFEMISDRHLTSFNSSKRRSRIYQLVLLDCIVILAGRVTLCHRSGPARRGRRNVS